MRGSFVLAVLPMVASMLGAVGCGDASTDIAAGEHGKRLNLVNGESVENSENVVIRAEPKAARATKPASEYRDFTGVVLVTATASVLHEWLLSEDGATLTTRECPVAPVNGAKFHGCSPWSAPEPVSSVGLADPVRSFSAYLFPQVDGSFVLHETVLDMSGDTRSDRSCAIVNGAVAEDQCGDWASSDEATALGIPQERAFDDEVDVSYLDTMGKVQLSQEVVSLTGSQAWSRTCAATEVTPCSFSDAVPLSKLGIHYTSIEGIGGYTYLDGDETVYAQTVIAPGGSSAVRRLCPVSASKGVDLEQCGSWQGVDLAAIPSTNDAVL